LKFPDPIPYKPEGVIGIDRDEGNLTAFVTSAGEIREIDTGDVGKVNRDHLRREIRGTRGRCNPKAKKKIASKHRRIRREKTESFWHHLALALEDLWGMKERIGKGKPGKMRQRLLHLRSIMKLHRMRGEDGPSRGGGEHRPQGAEFLEGLGPWGRGRWATPVTGPPASG
jgi:hypothetical protein